MTKDEMKNRISLALKDSILQQGFEIICKENAELQKKIRCECTRCVYSDSPCIRSDYGVENDEDVCPNYKNVFVAYTQLKEENAELKEKLKPENCLKLLAKEGYVKFTCENGNEHDQLNKAKEIIKKLKALFLFPIVTEDDIKRQDEILTEAEQFLKNSEVEK